VRGWSGLSGRTVEPQEHRVAGALAGREAQPELSRKCELGIGEGEGKRCRHSVQPEGSWSAGTRVEAGPGMGGLREGGAAASRAAMGRSARCRPYVRWASARRGARWVASSTRSAVAQTPGAAFWMAAHWSVRAVGRRKGSWGGRVGREQGQTARRSQRWGRRRPRRPSRS
jgi:hypothetical protein